MSIKLYIQPNYTGTGDRGEGGIRRVTEAMIKYLPEFGIEITNDIRRADITNGHGVMRPLKPHTPFVSSCHGMYWHGYDWANWAHQVNGEVTEALISADAITAPSQWVASALTRGILRRPHVVYHGVDADEWAHSESNEGYVLWNKARVDPVSDPEAVNRLAAAMPNTRFVSTFGGRYPNLSLIGAMPLPEMKRVIQRAGVYLCTARETFGIGTLEALAAGVPVVGWKYGGQAEIIMDGETGYLVEYGDYAALSDAVNKAIAQRARLSQNAIVNARILWQWKPRIAKYAQIFHDVYNSRHATAPVVSVVVPCHNLAQFLPACLDSVLRQPFKKWECLIIDDCSTDNSADVAKAYAAKDQRFRYLHTGENLKLSRALTFGTQHARGRYLINLDADNMFAEDSLSDCARELDNDPALHIVYGSLDTISADGSNRARNAFPGAFEWRGQIAHLNQIHSGAMMRREVAIELGGWRERQWRAEDAEFWTRATSFGFRAKRITENPTLIYRIRADSKGALEHRHDGGDGSWAAWFPFATAASGTDGQVAMQEKRPIARIETVPFSAQGNLAIEKKNWPVFHHQEPVISVIIPCSYEHRRYVIDALDSLMAQDFIEWEAIVINDCEPDGKYTSDYNVIPGAPYARVYSLNAEVGQKRNYGASVARGKFLYFLDADDYLLPGALRKLLEAYAEGGASYIFSDYVEVWDSWDSGLEYFRDQFNYSRGKNDLKSLFRDRTDAIYEGKHGEKFSLENAEANSFGRRIYLDEYNQLNRNQAITNILISKSDFESVGGFDPTLSSREDWDFLCKLAVNGKCGKRIACPGFVYRLATGTRRNIGLEQKAQLSQIIKQRYDRYYSGDGVTMSECCGGNDQAILSAKRAVAFAYGDAEGVARYAPKPEKLTAITSGITPLSVRLEFTGSQLGPVPFAGKNGRSYRGANSVKYKYIDAHAEDAEKLIASGQWRLVKKDPVIPQSELDAMPPIGYSEVNRAIRGWLEKIGDVSKFTDEELEKIGAMRLEDGSIVPVGEKTEPISEPPQAPIIDLTEIESFNAKEGLSNPVPENVLGIDRETGKVLLVAKEAEAVKETAITKPPKRLGKPNKTGEKRK